MPPGKPGHTPTESRLGPVAAVAIPSIGLLPISAKAPVDFADVE